jgi:peptide/nickel transport system substrate-binding protein
MLKSVLRLGILSALLLSVFTVSAQSACPASTLADTQGLSGTYEGQFDLPEFEAAAGCELTFTQNPLFDEAVAAGTLPAVEARIPAEALVIQPYEEIGAYGGIMYGVALQPESGTSEILSWHHANLVRYADDQRTIVPHVARAYEVSDDFTEITFYLREGHLWSDGAPFTADDVVFWYNDLQLNPELNPEPKSQWLIGGEPMTVEKVDDLTVRFSFAAPAPNFLTYIATTYIQFFRPMHFLSQFHIAYNPDANTLATERGFDDWTQLLQYYYPTNDWVDVPAAPLLAGDPLIAPTLEAFVRTAETPTYREWTANPYYFAVDTAGNQLPYIDMIREDFVEAEVQTLRITQGEVTLKAQDATFSNIAVYRENEANGNYTTILPLGQSADNHVTYGLNPTVPDPVLRELFADVRFAQALSLAINRAEVNELVYFGQGRPMQWLPIDHLTVDFVTDEMLNTFADYDVESANTLLDEMGLTERNSDGIRLRPDGEPLVLRVNYSLQGGPRQVHELVRDYWRAIGINMDLNELSSDELGSLLENNEHAIGTWTADGTAATELPNSARFAPPFNARDIGAGTVWFEHFISGGERGEEPPADVLRLFEIQRELNTVAVGSPEFEALVLEAVEIHQNRLFLIGVVGDLPKPIIVSNALGNFPDDRIDFYGSFWHMFPYRPWQFFLKNS